ncbi:hypothetical protein SFRURICE_013740 [Spodoptera frugiperda]|nr:hypothetical protein SFRURICE_013740 [Spodoptera frugiperda]
MNPYPCSVSFDVERGPNTLGFCLIKSLHICSHTHDTQTRNHNLWITQRVASCGHRTHYTLRGCRLPSYRANRAVTTAVKFYFIKRQFKLYKIHNE